MKTKLLIIFGSFLILIVLLSGCIKEFTEKQSIVLIVKIEGIHIWLEKLQSKRKNEYGKPKSD